MTLEQIIKDNAAYCRNVSVTMCRHFETVEIEDDSGDQEPIFLQGDDASNFIDEFDKLVEQAPDVLFEDCIKHMAKPYCENLWN